MKISHWETGKAGYAGAGAMLLIRESEDLQKENIFARAVSYTHLDVYKRQAINFSLQKAKSQDVPTARLNVVQQFIVESKEGRVVSVMLWQTEVMGIIWLLSLIHI